MFLYIILEILEAQNGCLRCLPTLQETKDPKVSSLNFGQVLVVLGQRSRHSFLHVPRQTSAAARPMLLPLSSQLHCSTCHFVSPAGRTKVFQYHSVCRHHTNRLYSKGILSKEQNPTWWYKNKSRLVHAWLCVCMSKRERKRSGGKGQNKFCIKPVVKKTVTPRATFKV